MSGAGKVRKFQIRESVMNQAIEHETMMWLGFGVFTGAMAFGSAVVAILSVAIVP